MKIDVRFTRMNRSESLESFAEEKVRQALPNEELGGHAQVWLVCDRSKFGGHGAPQYRCEIEVRSKRRGGFVAKVNSDVKAAIHEAVGALKGVLRENSKRFLATARRAPARALRI